MLAPWLLELTRELSAACSGLITLLGLLLWLYGAHSHRFWLAITVTVSAGVIGLFLGRDFAVQPLVAGLLLALSAGVLSLALARIALFGLGGLAGALLASRIGVEGHEPVAFLLGGLVGVGLYRLWITLLSSLFGTILIAYGTTSLLDKLGRLDSVSWAETNGPLINWGMAFVAVLGVVVQYVMDRRRAKKQQEAENKPEEKKEEPPVALPPPPPPPPPLPWWKKPLSALNKAG